MLTRDEYLKEMQKEFGEHNAKEFMHLRVGFDNNYYAMLENEIKQGKLITRKVYESLTDGQRYHFNKHYNFRNDRIQD